MDSIKFITGDEQFSTVTPINKLYDLWAKDPTQVLNQQFIF